MGSPILRRSGDRNGLIKFRVGEWCSVSFQLVTGFLCVLLQKDSCDSREWIQMVHDSHGSVERSSISQARSINQNGIFTISAPPKSKVKGF